MSDNYRPVPSSPASQKTQNGYLSDTESVTSATTTTTISSQTEKRTFKQHLGKTGKDLFETVPDGIVKNSMVKKLTKKFVAYLQDCDTSELRMVTEHTAKLFYDDWCFYRLPEEPSSSPQTYFEKFANMVSKEKIPYATSKKNGLHLLYLYLPLEYSSTPSTPSTPSAPSTPSTPSTIKVSSTRFKVTPTSKRNLNGEFDGASINNSSSNNNSNKINHGNVRKSNSVSPQSRKKKQQQQRKQTSPRPRRKQAKDDNFAYSEDNRRNICNNNLFGSSSISKDGEVTDKTVTTTTTTVSLPEHYVTDENRTASPPKYREKGEKTVPLSQRKPLQTIVDENHKKRKDNISPVSRSSSNSSIRFRDRDNNNNASVSDVLSEKSTKKTKGDEIDLRMLEESFDKQRANDDDEEIEGFDDEFEFWN